MFLINLKADCWPRVWKSQPFTFRVWKEILQKTKETKWMTLWRLSSQNQFVIIDFFCLFHSLNGWYLNGRSRLSLKIIMTWNDNFEPNLKVINSDIICNSVGKHESRFASFHGNFFCSIDAEGRFQENLSILQDRMQFQQQNVRQSFLLY